MASKPIQIKVLVAAVLGLASSTEAMNVVSYGRCLVGQPDLM